MTSDRLPVLPTTWRLITFRATTAELQNLDRRFLAFGLLCTWIAGVGRSWDDFTASPLRHSGIGSLVYVVVLALLLWLVNKPLSKLPLTYERILIFVCLTSPPAILYAIPVERFLSVEISRNLNLIFLLVVAVWRVSLLVFFLRRGLEFNIPRVTVGTLLPLSLVMGPLTIFQLQHRAMQAMAGLRSKSEPESAVADITLMLGMLAIYALLPLLFWYSHLARLTRFETQQAEQSTTDQKDAA